MTPSLKNKYFNKWNKKNTAQLCPSLSCVLSWTLTAKNKRKTITTEVRCLRRMLKVTKGNKNRKSHHQGKGWNSTSTAHHPGTAGRMVWPCYTTITIQHSAESIHAKNCSKQKKRLPMKEQGGNYRNLIS